MTITRYRSAVPPLPRLLFLLIRTLLGLRCALLASFKRLLELTRARERQRRLLRYAVGCCPVRFWLPPVLQGIAAFLWFAVFAAILAHERGVHLSADPLQPCNVG